MRRVAWTSLLGVIALGLGGCRCAEDPEHTPMAAGSAETAPTGTSTAEAPRTPPEVFDIVRNLHACEIRHRGLSIDVGSESANARRGFSVGPFDDVLPIDRLGATFGQVQSSSLRYQFWLDEPVKEVFASLRVHGGIARGMTAYFDNRRLGSAKLATGETRVVRFPVERDLEAGRHTLLLRFWGRQRGQTAPYAELDWIRLGVEDDISATYAAPTLQNIVSDVVIDGKPRRSLVLRGPSSVRCPMRVAADAELRVALGFWGAGKGVAQVRVVQDDDEPVVLHERTVTGGEGAAWLPVKIDLGAYAGKLVALELEVLQSTAGGRVAFGDASIVREDPRPVRVPEARTVVLVISSGVDRRRIPPWGPIGELNALGELVRAGSAFSGYRAPTTLPAGVIASMLTGMPPRVHAVEDQAARLPEQIRTISEMVKEAGGRAAMFTGAPTTFAAFGFDQGWDRFSTYSPVKDLPATEPFLAAKQWLERELDEDEPGSRLVVIHTRGAHPPWDLTREEVGKLNPDEYGGVLQARRGGIILNKIRNRPRRRSRRLSDEDWVRLRALEDAAMRKQNTGLGSLTSLLRRKQAWDSTLFFFVGDVAVGDPPDVPHHPSGDLEEDRLLVPLLVKFPGQRHAGKEVRAAVTAVDIGRTILEALRMEVPEQVVGTDLYSVAAGNVALIGRPVIATLGPRYSTRLGSWLLRGKHNDVPKLCRLDVDPACITDLFDDKPIAAQATWHWTFDAEHSALAEGRRVPREPAQIDADTAAALTVWGDI